MQREEGTPLWAVQYCVAGGLWAVTFKLSQFNSPMNSIAILGKSFSMSDENSVKSLAESRAWKRLLGSW